MSNLFFDQLTALIVEQVLDEERTEVKTKKVKKNIKFKTT